jgi:hypothetical protein
MQTLFKNLFNSIDLLKIYLFGIFTKIFRELFIKGTSRYRKINFFTTSALLICIIGLISKSLNHTFLTLNSSFYLQYVDYYEYKS